MLAGTEPNGILYRISGRNDAFVLYDANLPEIRSIVLGEDGTIYAAALGGGVSRAATAAYNAATSAQNQASDQRYHLGNGDRARRTAAASAAAELLGTGDSTLSSASTFTRGQQQRQSDRAVRAVSHRRTELRRDVVDLQSGEYL